MKTILILSTYPATNARHGGQVRLANIIAAYERGGWRTFPVSIFPVEGYPGYSSPHSIPFPDSSPFRLFEGKRVYFVDDLLSGPFATTDPDAWGHLLSILPDQIDAVHVEQPWLWPLAEKLRSLPQYGAMLLVYGSANFEEALKRKILEPYEVPARERILAEVAAVERRATVNADLVLAVTPSEKDVLETWGAKKVTLARNGISPWRADSDSLARWRSKLPTGPWLLYVASAHPPNFDGVGKQIAGSLACFPPDSALVVAGSVSEHIYHELENSRWRGLNLSRLKLLYSLADEDLAAVKTLAHGFFLPVQYGAGSNIKTAEALLSGKYVVGTSVAFRGFDDFRNLPEVRIADSPVDLHRSIRDVLNSPPTGESDMEGTDGLRSTLTWTYALKDMPSTVAGLVEGRAGARLSIA